MNEMLEKGARNCVVECGGVQRGARMFVVCERGAVDPPVVQAIIEAGRDAGAEAREVWGDRIPKERSEEVPAEVLEAYREADLIVSHYPSLKREVLFEHFGNETRVRVPNRARTVALLASDWARFPYSLQRAVAARLDERMAAGVPWRITSPAGTDVHGVFGGTGGEVGSAFFVDTGEDGRARRNFPGGVHSPHSSATVDGTIVVEYIDNVMQSPTDEPLRIEIRGSRIVGYSGGDTTGKVRAAIEASDGWIDSWHAGVHPRTLVPIGRRENAREWFSYSHCSPLYDHFHLGRTHATINLACYAPSLVVAGEELYDRGRLRVWDDPAVAEALRASAIPPRMLENCPVPLW